ncbi:MAG: cell division protein ZapA [Candidatus Coatesbacteria bacterium]|nr:cell division protein ZapA [Candidatus Coatesbacteria bacterium]
MLNSDESLASEVEVEVLGQRYAFKSASSPEQVQRVAEFVNELAGDLRVVFPSASSHRISILAVMQLGYELLLLRDEYQILRKRLEKESERLLQLIE